MVIPPTSAGPHSAMAASARGLQRAGALAADAAGRAAAAGAPMATSAEDGTARAVLEAGVAAPDLAVGMMDLIVARRAYQANAVALRRADEMAGELLRRRA